MKLKVLATYRNRDTQYPAGRVIEVSQAEAEFLDRDAPGCFEPYEEPEPEPAEPEIVDLALEAPPEDKMVHGKRTK